MTESSPPTGTHGWRGGAARKTPGGRDPARKRKILILGGVMLAIAGAVVALLFYLRSEPQPVFASFVIDQYSPPIPTPPFADADRKAVEFTDKKIDTFTSQQRGLLVKELRNLGERATSGQPLVVYLRAFAVVTRDGVMLLPGDARIDDETTWLPLGEVFAALKESHVKHRLLLLDLAGPLADARSGVLLNDVAVHLEKAVEEAVADPAAKGLQVLTACSPGQVSLPSEELGHTVFVHYILRGLAGRADGAAGGKKVGRVYLRDLAAYVAAETDRWAWQNRRARQTPKLYGEGDYPLTVTQRESPPVPALDKAYPDWLLDGWKVRDGWWQEQRTYRTKPALYEKLEAALLRAEARWRGADPRDVKGDLRIAMREVDEARGKPPAKPERADSLAQEVAGGKKPPQEAFALNRGRLKDLARIAADPKASKEDAMKLMKEKADFLKDFKDRDFDLAWTIFRAAAVEEKPVREELKFWSELLPKVEYEEVQALQNLLRKAAALPAQPDAWPGEAVGLALKVAEQAAVAHAVPAHWRAWEAWLNAKAEDDRRAGEKGLFAANPEERARAADSLRNALTKYRRNNLHLQTLQNERFPEELKEGGYRGCDEALVFLAAYPPYLEYEPADRVELWKRASADARDLDKLLEKPPPEGGPAADELFRQIEALSGSLQDKLKILRQPLAPEQLKRLIDQRQRPTGADSRDMSALLLLPTWGAGDRTRLWSAWRDLAGRLNADTDNADAPPPFDPAKAQRQERDRGLVRAQVALTLLQANGSSSAEKVRLALEKVNSSQEATAPWQALAAELRRASTAGR
jgi:hypothetical protein